MFLGHYGLAMGAKRAAPRPSLGLLIGAAQLADLIWPIFLLAGWERVRIAPGDTAVTPLAFEHYPWSHSLAMELVWGLALALVYGAVTRDRRGALVLGALVPSHWVLDLVAHRPDLPLYPGGAARYGLGLWNSVAGTLVVEIALFAAGAWLYARATRPRDGVGRWGLVGLLALLAAIYAGNLLGPPPPDARTVAWGAMAGWLAPLLGWWVDRHREPLARAAA
ncbi:MAG TPA: hypothetical protein VFS05_07945 [Gemmatimonadaceae bacterium]|nr:hypothetical protein [Gemmatimonadaceae bacterium]